MTTRIDCNIKPIDDLLKKNWDDLPEDQQSDINRRIEDSLRRMKAVGRTATDSGVPTELQARAAQHFSYMMQTANNVSISPHSQRNFGYYMANLLGVQKGALGLGDSFTAAGGVSNTLQSMRRKGQGTVHELLNRIHFIDNAIEADKVLERVRGAHGIARNEWDKFKLDTYEIGNQPYLQKDYAIVGPNGVEYLRNLQTRYFDDMVRLGITQAEGEEIAGAIQKVVDNFHATLEILHEFGIKVNDSSELINYLPRNFSQETLRRIGWSKKSDSFEVFGFGDQVENVSITSVFTKSRHASHYVPEDAIVLDTLLTAANPLIYDVLGVTGIDDLLSDTGAFTRAFVDVIDKIQPELFDAMVDVGLVSKLPMTGTQLFEYMKKRYELPFQELNEWQAVDFTSITALYKQQAERLAGKSVMAHFTVKAAVEGGWGITEQMKRSDPAQYGSYIQLTSPSQNNRNVVLRTGESQRLGLEVFQNANVYVHPIVGELFRAQIDVLSDPNQLGIISRMSQDFATIFSQMALVTSGFVHRQLYAPVFQTWAGGGRIDTYAATMKQAMHQIGSLKVRGLSLETFDQVFDDKRKLYRVNHETLVSQRGLWRWMRQTGEVEELMPFMGEAVASLNYKPTARGVEIPGIGFDIPGSSQAAGVQRQARYLWDVMQTHQLNGGQKIQEMYKTANTGWRRFSDQAFYIFGATNQLFDNMGRFALLQDLTNTSNTNRFVRGLQGNFQEPMNFDDAMKRVNQYFFRYDNRGKLDEWMRHIRPFWMFTSRNTFSIFRMLVREPGKFMAYQRLFAALNEPDQEEDPLPRGSVAEWVEDSAPSFWIIRDDAGNPISYFTLPRSQMDNIASGVEDMTSGMDSFLDYFGIWPNNRGRSISDRYSDLDWDKTPVNRGLQKWAAGSYGHLQALYAYATGIDPRTGSQLRTDDTGLRTDSLWGVEISPMNKFLLESLFPIARSVNRSNPGGIFGMPPRFEGTEMVDEGRPSWTGASRNPNSADFRTWWQRTASAAGFNIYNFDVLEQLGYRQTEVSFAIREGYKALGAKRRQLQTEQDPQKLQIGLEQLRAMEALQAALILDYTNISEWASSRGLDYPAAIRSMRRNNMTADQLDGLSEEQKMEILRRVYGENLLAPLSTPEYVGD